MKSEAERPNLRLTRGRRRDFSPELSRECQEAAYLLEHIDGPTRAALIRMIRRNTSPVALEAAARLFGNGQP